MISGPMPSPGIRVAGIFAMGLKISAALPTNSAAERLKKEVLF
jgi:hypothetical protein